MQNITEKIVNIDKNEITCINAVAGDINTRFINFRFISNNKIINLKDTHVRIYAKTANYNEVFNELTIIDEDKGIAQLELTDTLLTPGTTRYELKIMPAAGGYLSSNIMELHVSKPLMQDFNPVNTNEYKAFELNLQKIDGVDSKIKNLEDAAKTYDTKFLEKVAGTSEDSYRFNKKAIEIGNDDKNITAGVGGSDVYVKNSKSNKYLALKDDGRLIYDDKELQVKPSSKALWEGHHHMADVDGDTITLNKKVSECCNGIILVWSDFDDGQDNKGGIFNDFNWTFSYVPKQVVALNSGGNMLFQVPLNDSGQTCVKTLYITDTQITGASTNRNKDNSNNTNDAVLRAVYEY